MLRLVLIIPTRNAGGMREISAESKVVRVNDDSQFVIKLTKNKNQSLYSKYIEEHKKVVAEMRAEIKAQNAENAKYNKEAKLYNEKSIWKRRGLFDRKLKEIKTGTFVVDPSRFNCRLYQIIRLLRKKHFIGTNPSSFKDYDDGSN